MLHLANVSVLPCVAWTHKRNHGIYAKNLVGCPRKQHPVSAPRRHQFGVHRRGRGDTTGGLVFLFRRDHDVVCYMALGVFCAALGRPAPPSLVPQFRSPGFSNPRVFGQRSSTLCRSSARRAPMYSLEDLTSCRQLRALLCAHVSAPRDGTAHNSRPWTRT